MYCLVFRRFQNGDVLAEPLRGVFGQLHVLPSGYRDLHGAPPSLYAKLLAADGTDALPHMSEVRVRRITNEALVLKGREVLGPGSDRKVWQQLHDQVWVCRVIIDSRLKALNGSAWPGGAGHGPGMT